jgi:DNA-binding XRE family transcriptional regulator
MAGHTITAAQCRAGRGLIGLTQTALAEKARCAPKTVVDFEAGGVVPSAGNMIAIIAVLDNAGVDFIAEDAAGGVGVRMKLKK